MAQKELLQEWDYEHEAAATRQFKLNLASYPEFAVPAVVPALSSKHVLTTEWMPGMPIDRAAAQAMSLPERNRVGSRLLWLSLHGGCPSAAPLPPPHTPSVRRTCMCMYPSSYRTWL